MTNSRIITAETLIHSKPQFVWDTLTDIALMKQWMGEDLQLDIETGWGIGEPFTISGFHHVKFVNRGTVLQFEPNKHLVYTHLNSISDLADEPGNYCVFDFQLEERGDFTLLKLSITNFPTETIYKHLELYWRGTLKVIKDFVESKKG